MWRRELTDPVEFFGMDMQFLGTIEPGPGAAADPDEWIMLIGAHSSLALVSPQHGINPFTKQPHLFKPAADYANVVLDGAEVGAIHWAEDGSHRLVVWSVAAAKTQVTEIARDVASKLGRRFVLGEDA
jgi:hypothetical protein